MRAVMVMVILTIGVLVVSGVASATETARTVADWVVYAGTITGSASALVSVDGSAVRANESYVNASTFQQSIMRPDGDNITAGWGTMCGSYYACIDDVNPDQNVSIIWTVGGIAEWRGPVQNAVVLGAPWELRGVGIVIQARHNNTGTSNLTVALVDPWRGIECGATYLGVALLLNFQFLYKDGGYPSDVWTSCAGEPWTQALINRLELRLGHDNTNDLITVSFAAAYLWFAQGGVWRLDAVFRAPTQAGDTPVRVSYTCNRTAVDTYTLAAWRAYPNPTWVALRSGVCAVGAQTNYTDTLPSGATWVDAGAVRMRWYSSGTNTASMGSVWWDRMVVDVEVPTVETPSLPSVVLGLFVAALLLAMPGAFLLFVFLRRKRRREAFR